RGGESCRGRRPTRSDVALRVDLLAEFHRPGRDQPPDAPLARIAFPQNARLSPDSIPTHRGNQSAPIAARDADHFIRASGIADTPVVGSIELGVDRLGADVRRDGA